MMHTTSLFDELNDIRVVVFMLLVIIRDLLLYYVYTHTYICICAYFAHSSLC